MRKHKKTVHDLKKVSEDGLSPTGEYIEVVKTWPMPKTRKALRGFIGKVWNSMKKNPAENCSSANAAALRREGRKLTHRSCNNNNRGK